MGYSRLVLKTGVIDPDLLGQFYGNCDSEFYAIWLARAITHHRFVLESPNCTQRASWDTISWYWKWRSLTWTFNVILAILTRLVRVVTFNRFELESPNLHQICMLGFSQLVLEMGAIDRDLQGHLAISADKTAFNIALVHWSKPAKGCYTSQTGSCLSYVTAYSCTDSNVDSSDAILMLCSQLFCNLVIMFFPGVQETRTSSCLPVCFPTSVIPLINWSYHSYQAEGKKIFNNRW